MNENKMNQNNPSTFSSYYSDSEIIHLDDDNENNDLNQIVSIIPHNADFDGDEANVYIYYNISVLSAICENGELCDIC